MVPCLSMHIPQRKLKVLDNLWPFASPLSLVPAKVLTLYVAIQLVKLGFKLVDVLEIVQLSLVNFTFTEKQQVG